MRFGTFFFFQAPPGHRHEDIIRRELEQIEWTEELDFDEAWLTEIGRASCRERVYTSV